MSTGRPEGSGREGGHGAEPTRTAPRLLARLWGAAVRRPRLTLVLLVALETLPGLGLRDLWLGDEVRHGSVLQHVVRDGDVVVLHLNGEPYPDKPPLWFWIVGTLARLAGSTEPWVFYLAAALSTALLALATLRLAREVGGLSEPASLASAVALTVLPLTLLLSRTTRMDLLFSAFIVAAGTALFRGLTRPHAARSTLAAFAWAGAATWTKGPLGLALPLAGAVAFLAWRGRLRRLLAPDVLLGLGLYTALVGAWALGVAWTQGGAFLGQVLHDQVLGRFVDAPNHREPAWFYLAVLAPCVAPLSLLPFTLPWRPGGWAARLRTAWARRRSGDDGRAWLTASSLAGLGLLSLSSSKFFIYLAPLLAPLTVLGLGALDRAPAPVRVRQGAWVAAFEAVLALALAFVALALPSSGLTPLDLVPSAAALLVAGGATWSVRHAPLGPSTLASALGLLPALGLAACTLLPALNPVLSPRATGLRLRELEAQGYVPAAYKLYGGQLAYHLGHPLFETRDPDALAAFLARWPRAVVVLSVDRWERLHERIPGLTPAYEQAFLGDTYLLAVEDLGSGSPGAVPR